MILEENAFFEILRIAMLWLSPLIVIVGMLLLILNRGEYGSLEDKLARDLGGIKKRVVPLIETNIDTLQQWMLERKSIVGVVFIVYFLVIFFSLK